MGMKEKTGLAKVRARSTAIAATVFLLPTILLIIVYMIYPIIDTFVISMYKWNGISSDRVFIGFTNWQNLLVDGEFWTSFGHNVIVMVFSILLQIPIGLLLATFLDALGKKANAFKIVWFFPYLMSSVAIAFLFTYALATNGGIFSELASLIAGKNVTVDLLGRNPQALYTVIGVMAWQFTPFYMVYFIAGYSNIDTSIYEAAIIDGASKLRRVWSIDLPSIKSTIIILLIMNMGSVLTTGFEKIYLMQNSLNISASEVIDTYVYKIGLASPIANYSYPTAIGLFQSLIGMVLIIGTNILAKKVGEESLW